MSLEEYMSFICFVYDLPSNKLVKIIKHVIVKVSTLKIKKCCQLVLDAMNKII